MNIYIVGAGAVGTWFGERLQAVGSTVSYAPRLLEDVTEVAADIAVVAVKAYDTPGAIATLQRALGDRTQTTTVLTLQNGVGNEDALAKVFGANNVLSGAITVPVERQSDGTIAAANKGGIGIAPVGDQPHNWFLAGLAATEIPMVVTQSYRSLKWSKLALNITANASCAILNMMPAMVLADSRLFALEMEALREIAAIMRAAKLRVIDLPRYPVRALLAIAAMPAPVASMILRKRIARSRGAKLPSLLLDLRAEQTRSEVAWLNGAVASAGRSLRIATPVNAAFTRVLDDIVTMPALWSKYREHPQALIDEVTAQRQRYSTEVK